MPIITKEKEDFIEHLDDCQCQRCAGKNPNIEFAKGGYLFNYVIFDEEGNKIDGGMEEGYGNTENEAKNNILTRIEEGLNDGEQVEVHRFNTHIFNPPLYAKGGSVEFTDLSDNTQPYKTWEGKTSKNNKQKSVGAFSHNIKGRYVGDYYLYMLNDWDQDYYSHLPLKNGEILMRIETERMVGGEMPLIKINVDKGWVYFMSDENNLNSDEDDKNPKFNTRTADVNYLSLDKNIQKDITRYEKGGKTSKFWEKTKELGRKGFKKSKEMAHEANEYRKEHLHLKRKQIAHNVGLETSRIIEDKVDKGEITSKKALKLDKKLLEARDIEMEHYTYPEGPEANYKVKNMSRNINPMDPYFAKGGNTESGSWSIEISEDDDTEKNQWFIREQIARLINEGKTSGTNPTWTLTTNSVDKIGSTERSHISEMVSEGYGEGEIEDDYAKGGLIASESQWKEYRAVQDGGYYNMFDPRAREMTSMSKGEYVDILKNYAEYEKKYGRDSDYEVEEEIVEVRRPTLKKKYEEGGTTFNYNDFFNEFKMSNAYISEPLTTKSGKVILDVEPHDQETSEKMKDYMRSKNITFYPNRRGKGFTINYKNYFAKGGKTDEKICLYKHDLEDDLGTYDDIEDIENDLCYTYKPYNVKDVDLDSTYDWRKLRNIIDSHWLRYRVSNANHLIKRGNFFNSEDDEFENEQMWTYYHKTDGNLYLIKTEGASYPRYVVRITNVPKYLQFAKGGKTFEYDPNIDYFSEYELLPENIQQLMSDEGELEDYNQTERLLKKLEEKGWTFEYGLGNEVYDLRPIMKSEKYGSEYKKDEDTLFYRPMDSNEEWSEVSDEAFDEEERKEFDKEMESIFKEKVIFVKGGKVEGKGNEIIIGGLVGVLLGIFLNK